MAAEHEFHPIIHVLFTLCGVTYFLMWSGTFWEQILLNHRLKSGSGLSSAFVLLNVAGFSAYAVSTTLECFYEPVRTSFEKANNGLVPQVAWNDSLFAVHGAICCVYIAWQYYIYATDNVSKAKMSIGTLIALCFPTSALIAGFSGITSWNFVIKACGAVKLTSTICKCTPQVYYNWARKSTVGFSWRMIRLDFWGSVLSMGQQLFEAILIGSMASFTKNVAKTGLGFFSLMFDIIFLYQHFILYNPDNVPDDVLMQQQGYQAIATKPTDDQAGKAAIRV